MPVVSDKPQPKPPKAASIPGSSIDLGLPAVPGTHQQELYEELLLVYLALRTLQDAFDEQKKAFDLYVAANQKRAYDAL